MENINELKTLLKEPKKIICIGHKSPDGDAVGSILGLSKYLELKGHKVTAMVPDDFPAFLNFLPGTQDILVVEREQDKAYQLIEQADIIFLMDFNDLTRVEMISANIAESAAKKILIDHHLEPSIFDFNYSDTDMPATCQMVYHFLEKLEDTDVVDQPIATCLYTGIMTDTGNFRFPSVKKSTHLVVAELIEKGAKPHKINGYVYDQNSPQRFKLLGTMLSKMELLTEVRTAIIQLSKEDLNQGGYEKGRTDGFVNYGLGVRGNVLSVAFFEDIKKDFVKISFRSKGDFDVNTFARTHFNGGGHKNAAGGRSDLSLPETILKFKEILEDYKDQLKNVKI